MDETTPIIFDEFKQCNSEYVISDKDSESAISSDGEFIDAGRINIYEEDDSYIDRIETIKEKKALRDSIYNGLDYQSFQKAQQPVKYQPLKTFQALSLKK